MTLLETNFHWITGLMFGVELLNTDDLPPQANAKWGFVIDLGIMRIIFILRKV